jgi:hypothetical protein
VIATTSSGDTAERVIGGVNGFLVPPGSLGALLERMTLQVGDPELRRRMGRASVENVASQSPRLWADAFESAIDKILAMPPRDIRPGRRVQRRAAK